MVWFVALEYTFTIILFMSLEKFQQYIFMIIEKLSLEESSKPLIPLFIFILYGIRCGIKILYDIISTLNSNLIPIPFCMDTR